MYDATFREDVKKAMKELALDELESAKNLPEGSEERSRAVQNACRLQESIIKDMAEEAENDDKTLKRELQEQIAADDIARKDKSVWETRIKDAAGIGVQVLGAILPVAASAVLFREGLAFETDGVIKSTMVRNLIGKIRFWK